MAGMAAKFHDQAQLHSLWGSRQWDCGLSFNSCEELQDGDSPALNRSLSEPGALVLLEKVALSVICPHGQEGTAGFLRCSFFLLPFLISA